jgi:hypothetical protein
MTARQLQSAPEAVKCIMLENQQDTLLTSNLPPSVNVVGSQLAPIPVPRHSPCEKNTSNWVVGNVIEIDRQMVVR